MSDSQEQPLPWKAPPALEKAASLIVQEEHEGFMQLWARVGGNARLDMRQVETTASLITSRLLVLVQKHSSLTEQSGAWIVDHAFREITGVVEMQIANVQGGSSYGSLPQGAAEARAASLRREGSHIRERMARRIDLALTQQDLAAAIASEAPPSVAAIPAVELDGDDAKLIEKLLARDLQDAAASFRQAVLDLRRERSSWRGPAADLREALREVVDALAPDDEVKRQPDFKAEPARPSKEKLEKPTTRQKVRFIVKQRNLSGQVAQSAEGAVERAEEIAARFVDSVRGRSNRATHGSDDRTEATKLAALIRVALSDLLG